MADTFSGTSVGELLSGNRTTNTLTRNGTLVGELLSGNRILKVRATQGLNIVGKNITKIVYNVVIEHEVNI